MISKKTWDKLSPEDQEIIKKAGVEAGVYQRKVNRELAEKYLEEMKKAGIQCHRRYIIDPGATKRK
jgi:TRAP-type C4-dicarboxylate transport system substrate-binding protein